MTDENDDDKRAVKLDVLNKEHQSLVAAGQQIHRILLWEIILSAAALAFCFSWVAIGPQLSFGGMTVSVPQPDLLLGLAIVVTVLFWRLGSLQVYGKQRRRRIMTLYDELGYSEHTDRTGFSGFIYPDFLAVLSSLDEKASDYVVGVFQERPIKRSRTRTLAAVCWFLTYLVSLGLSLLPLTLPLIVNPLIAVYAWQHDVNGFAIVMIVVVLVVVYIAGVWMSVQTFDRREFARALSEPAAALQEFADYTHTSKPAPTDADTRFVDGQQGR
jgi:hypothetical protein